MPVNYDSVLETTVALAREAGGLVRDAFPRTALARIDYKGEVNPVTETDTAAEALIVNRLRAYFPDHRIQAEEGGFVGTQPDGADDAQAPNQPTWVVDPVDGTNNFAHGIPHFSVSLALQVGGEPVVGVIYNPLLDEMFTATAGGGFALNGDPARVSDTKRLEDAFLAAGFPYNRRAAADNNVERLDHFLRRSQGVRRAGSAALDLAYVACGRFDGYFEIRLSPWDVGAGVLLVREAGGRVTNFDNNPRGLSGDTILASNGHIHDEMLRVIRDGAAAPRPATRA
jgi:myo-inositol-1(or 4)-monophosphatase